MFYSMMCPKCGKWRSKEIRKSFLKAVFKCFYCNKSTKIKKESLGIVIRSKGPFGLGTEAANVTKKLNEG